MKYAIRVNKDEQNLYVRNGKDIVETMVCSTGCGHSVGDFGGITPNGSYNVVNVVDTHNTGWPGNAESKRRPYGPWMFVLNDPRGKLAIHGTDEPELLGKPVSHGCVRVSNSDIVKLKENYVEIGTLVEIVGGE